MELRFIGDRSRILGTIITPSGKLRAKKVKNEKNAPKLVTIARKLRSFLYIFRIYFLNIFDGGGLGDVAHSSLALTTSLEISAERRTDEGLRERSAECQIANLKPESGSFISWHIFAVIYWFKNCKKLAIV